MTGISRALLVLGGARSGKSAFAQAQAESSGLELVFLATAQALDDEMRARIAGHVAERGVRWSTLEAPFDLAETLALQCRPGRIVLVDCLTLWLSNLLLRGDDIERASCGLAEAVRHLAAPAIFVSNEVGAGIVPENALARRFRDAQGRLNRLVAEAADAVVLVVAGRALLLKPAPVVAITFR